MKGKIKIFEYQIPSDIVRLIQVAFGQYNFKGCRKWCLLASKHVLRSTAWVKLARLCHGRFKKNNNKKPANDGPSLEKLCGVELKAPHYLIRTLYIYLHTYLNKHVMLDRLV